MTRGAFSAMVVLLFSVTACGGSSPAAPSPPPVPARDSLNGITNLNPAIDTVLQPGQTLTISGTAGYTLATADLGSLMMIVKDQADRPIQTSSIGVVVARRGTGDATLTQTITVPSDGVTSIRVYFALAPAGATSTNVTLLVTYPVR